MTKTEVTQEQRLLVKRISAGKAYSQTGCLSLKPAQHPEHVNVISNLTVHTGKDLYDLQVQNGVTTAVHVADPQGTCKVFADPENILDHLLKDSSARYIGEKREAGVRCHLFETSSAFFAPLMPPGTGTKSTISIARDSAFPVRVSYKGLKSTGTWEFGKPEIKDSVNDKSFTAPAGLPYQEAEPDGRGGWRLRLSTVK